MGFHMRGTVYEGWIEDIHFRTNSDAFYGSVTFFAVVVETNRYG